MSPGHIHGGEGDGGASRYGTLPENRRGWCCQSKYNLMYVSSNYLLLYLSADMCNHLTNIFFAAILFYNHLDCMAIDAFASVAGLKSQRSLRALQKRQIIRIPVDRIQMPRRLIIQQTAQRRISAWPRVYCATCTTSWKLGT